MYAKPIFGDTKISKKLQCTGGYSMYFADAPSYSPFFDYFWDQSYVSTIQNCIFSPEMRSLPYLNIETTLKSSDDDCI